MSGLSHIESSGGAMVFGTGETFKYPPVPEYVCRRALREMRERAEERPFSRLFYEMAFLHREERCLAAAYSLWAPVMRSWIFRWEMGLRRESMDDIVDDLVYSAFDAILAAVEGGRFKDFEAGRVHNFLKRTLALKVFGRYRREKREIVSTLRRRRGFLGDWERRTLREWVLPEFREHRSPLEQLLFRAYLLEGRPVQQIARECKVRRYLESAVDPLRAVHNRVQTVLWNTYKVLKKREDGIEACREVMRTWMGPRYPVRRKRAGGLQ